MKSFLVLAVFLIFILALVVKGFSHFVLSHESNSSVVGAGLVSVSREGGPVNQMLSMFVNRMVEKYIDYLGVGDYLRNMKNASENSLPARVYIINNGSGDDIASCNDTVRAIVSEFYVDPLASLKDIESSKEFLVPGTERELKLDDNTPIALIIGVNGMKVGAERISISKKPNSSGKVKAYRINLLSGGVSSSLKLNRLIKLDDKTIQDGKVVLCGDNVSVRYVLKDLKGAEIGGGRVSFFVGSGSVPPAIDHGVVGMLFPNPRVIIAPPDLIYTGDERFLVSKSEASIIELYP